MRTEKPSTFRKIIIKFRQKIDKLNEKYKKSIELQAIVSMVLDILLSGFLIFLGYLAFTTDSIIFKIFGFGSLFWIIKNKVVEIITRILSSFHLVTINR